MPAAVIAVVLRLLLYVGALLTGSLFAKLYLLLKEWYKKRAQQKQERMREDRRK